MTEQDLEIQRLRAMLKAALKDLDYVLCQFEMCQICKYADADCPKGKCVPKWRGL